MGYLTTFTIYNGRAHPILEDPKAFCQELYDAASSGRGRTIGEGMGRIEIRPSRHADEHTVYAHLEGRVAEMVPWADETVQMMREEPDHFKAYAAQIKRETEKLSAQFRKQRYSLIAPDTTCHRSNTFTVYNDGIHLIKGDPGGFVEILHRALDQGADDDTEFGFGNGLAYHGNLIKAHRTLPATQPSMYVHMGNTVVELADGSPETNKLMIDHPSFMHDLLFFTAHNARRLQKRFIAEKAAQRPRVREKGAQTQTN